MTKVLQSYRPGSLNAVMLKESKIIEPPRFPETNCYKHKILSAIPPEWSGSPCIRGLRIPVATVIGMVADGMSHGEILKAYPDLEAGDIREALHFAAEAVRERELPLVG